MNAEPPALSCVKSTPLSGIVVPGGGFFAGILEHILAQRDCRVKRISSCKTVEEMVY